MFFKRKKKKKVDIAPLKPFKYEPKVILAWAEALGGNKEIRQWLLDNDFKELAIFEYAANLKEDARTWLLENGFAHLMALLEASEGRETAQKWLLDHHFGVLAYVGKAADRDMMAFKHLKNNYPPEYLHLAKKLYELKEAIEARHGDVHSISPD